MRYKKFQAGKLKQKNYNIKEDPLLLFQGTRIQTVYPMHFITKSAQT